MQRSIRSAVFVSAAMTALVLCAGCSATSAPDAAGATATPVRAEGAPMDAVAAGNPRSVTETLAAVVETPCAPSAQCEFDPRSASAALAPIAATAATSPTLQEDSQAPASQTMPMADDSLSRLPRERARVSLASGSRRVADFRLDANGVTAYVTTYDAESKGDYRLHIVDTTTMEALGEFAVSGDRITYDPVMQRLYLAPEAWAGGVDEELSISVFDLAQGMVVGELPGTEVAVDAQNDRLYVGDRPSYLDSEARGLRLYRASTLELLLEGSLAGKPLYNPARDELVVVNYSAFSADPETLELRDDLFPEISEQPLRACNGCTVIADVHQFPEAQVLLFTKSILSAGKGAGIIPLPAVLDQTTLQPVAQPLDLAENCSSQPALRGPSRGATLAHDSYSRYMTYNNLSLRDEAGALTAFRDGLGDAFENLAADAGYVRDSAEAVWVVDRPTLDILGFIPSYCFYTRAADGRLFASDGARHDLVLLEETGGESMLRPPVPALLDPFSIDSIRVSPAWVEDGTLFLQVSSEDGSAPALLRSTDRGATWARLEGLPLGEGTSFSVVPSPSFGSDGTLFAAGARDESAGLGVWRSEDRGETWQPMWNGLRDLRVHGLFVSPRFASDHTILAYARYTQIRPWESGVSIYRSSDAGLTWTRVITAESADLLPAPSVFLPITRTLDLPVRKEYFYAPVEYAMEDGGWLTATAAIGAGEMPVAILPSPGEDPLKELFVVTENAIYRTGDEGVSWWSLQDERMAGIAWGSSISAAATTPADADGVYRLLIGTRNGQLWQIDPASATWTVVEGEPQAREVATPAATLATSATVESTATVDTAVTVETTATVEATAAPAGESAQNPPALEDAATANASPLGDPPDGVFAPAGIFGDRWRRDPALQRALGFAFAAEPAAAPAAFQPFERGAMIWLGDNPRILVVLDDKTWSVHDDTFREGEMERDPNLYTPGELLQPVRGFGKLWRNDETLREAIGWATLPEKGETALVQSFERGLVVWAGSRVFVLVDAPSGRTWQ